MFDRNSFILKNPRSPESLVYSTLQTFNLVDDIKKNPSKINEIKRIAPRIEELLFPKISNENLEIQLSLL